MRTLLNEVKQIDDHIFGYAPTGDALVFEARIILSPALRDRVLMQQQAYSAIKQYGRKHLKAEIAQAQQKLMNQPEHKGFMQKIIALFKKL